MLSLLSRIPRGKVTTYKAIASKLGTKGYRAVGRALHSNPNPDTAPCYKVVASDGRLGGYALGGKEKRRRLKRDGIRVRNGRIAGFAGLLYDFE